MKIFTNYDFNGNQLLNVSLQQLATAPASPFTGQMYYNTTSNRVFTWNGTTWVGADAQGATMTGADIVSAINASGSLIDNDNLSSGVNTAISKAHDQAHKASHVTGGADIIDNFTSTTSGLVPLSGGGTTKYLRADGTWVVPPDTDTVYTHPNHTGDVTSVGDGATTIANKAVTLAKMADMATASFIGRNTASTGVPEILSVATVKTMLGLVLTQTSNASGFALAGGTTSKTLTVSNTLTLAGTDGSTLNIGTGGTLGTGAFATAYIHPNHTGDVTSVADGATTIANNAVTNAKVAQMATMTIKGNNTGGTANASDLTVAQVKTMLGLVLTQTSNATGFSLAGGTTSKTLTVSNTLTLAGTDSSTLNIGAGGTLGTAAFTASTAYEPAVANGTANQVYGMNNAGTAKEWKSFGAIGTTGTAPAWALSTANTITLNIPLASAGSVTAGLLSNTDYAKIHSQNTDTGTTSATFTIGSSGNKLKNNAGEIQIRNNADNAYADLRVGNLVVEGTTTTVNAETIELADNKLLLNSNITTSAGNDSGGLAVKRLMADNTTRKDAELYYDNSTGRWTTIMGAVTGTLVTSALTNKVIATIGDAVATSIPVTHNFNTRDCVVSIRESASPYAGVMCDWEFTDANTVTFKFAVAPTSGQFVVTIVG